MLLKTDAEILPRIAHVSKDAAKYTDHSKYPANVRRCGICEHFQKPYQCDLVRGRISPAGGCVLFDPELIPCELK
jgi:hypothetical protein